MSSYFKVFSTIAKKLKGNKTKVPSTITSVPPSKRNKIFGEQKEKISKTVDQFSKGVSEETKLKMRSGTSKTLGKISKILRGEKKEGGRIGRRFGSPNPKKTNVQKIKETFGPKKKLSPKQMKIAKLAGDPKRIDAPDFKKLRGKA